MKNNNPCFRKAKRIVLKTNNYSVSYLQRTLGIGYNTARELMKEVITSIEKDYFKMKRGVFYKK